MTANKYNNKHHVVDEHKRDAQRRARAAAISEKNERDLHARLLKVDYGVAGCSCVIKGYGTPETD